MRTYLLSFIDKSLSTTSAAQAAQALSNPLSSAPSEIPWHFLLLPQPFRISPACLVLFSPHPGLWILMRMQLQPSGKLPILPFSVEDHLHVFPVPLQRLLFPGLLLCTCRPLLFLPLHLKPRGIWLESQDRYLPGLGNRFL